MPETSESVAETLYARMTDGSAIADEFDVTLVGRELWLEHCDGGTFRVTIEERPLPAEAESWPAGDAFGGRVIG